MCGINGIFAFGDSAPPLDEAELLRVREAMRNRGPDGAGAWISADARVGLANRRLAVQDLSDAGAMPMATPDRRYVITFNGEIYNVAQLRAELVAAGVTLRSTGDTEVVLQLFARHGAATLERLRGMYAFAVWDNQTRRLFLARDPFGIKPLYYADGGGVFRFASQVKALLAGGSIAPDLDPAGAVGFFVWGCVPEPFTVCRAIRALPAGSFMWVAAAGVEGSRPFFSLRDELLAASQRPTPRPAERREWLRERVADSVRHHLVSDVPVGIFLSAGLDSSTITALAAETSHTQLHTLTLGFEEYRNTVNDEVPLAEQVARACGTRQHTSWVTKADFDQDLEALLAAMDQPSTDGANTYLISQRAAQAGMKVALSGLGGDELFGGYPSFRHVPMIRRYLAFGRALPALGKLVRRVSAPLLGRFASPKFASLLEYGGSDAGAYMLRRALFMPWELGDFMDPRTAAQGWEELRTLQALDASISGVRGIHARVAALELQWYMRNQLLRDSDWASMAHSLEVRVPLVDPVLVRGLAPLLVSDAPPNKQDFASTPRAPLPADVLEREKTGFLVPVREWTVSRSAGRGLRGWARRVLSTPKRVMSLVTDAFGGHGGIALYNRDLATAICNLPGVGELVVIPRLMPGPSEAIPNKMRHVVAGVGGKVRYGLTVLREVLRARSYDLICCAHINLLPLAVLAKRICRAPLVLCIYGIDAWEAPRNFLVRGSIRQVDGAIAISELTAERFAHWSGMPRERISILPNAIHLNWYEPREKSAALLHRYGLEGKTVIATLGRLISEERYKGFDQVLEALPELVEQRPDIRYLIMGDGTDRARLEARAAELGLAQHVVFTGYIPEREKADHLRLSDAFVMPSRGEGFGFVILEALACGIPVVGSKRDGTREALRDGLLGELVDPDDVRELRAAILRALGRRAREVPEGLAYFDFPRFSLRASDVLSRFLGTAA